MKREYQIGNKGQTLINYKKETLSIIIFIEISKKENREYGRKY